MKHLIQILFLFVILPASGQNKMFTPSLNYISQHRGTSSVEIPEVQELIHVIIAVASRSDSSLNFINKTTEYYQKVISTFEPFKEHKIVETIYAMVKANPANYYFLKMDGTGFYFNEDNQLLKEDTYDRLGWNKKNVIDPLLTDISDFAHKSNFRQFFKDNHDFYSYLIDLMKIQSPIDKQWRWLEKEFVEKYDNYRITFSPLVRGSHSTQFFETAGFRQIVMFVESPYIIKKYNDQITEGLLTRMVFTEIDHNYVNPISHKYKKQIKQIFKDRSKWTDTNKGTDWYGSPELIFNEYMTWAVFTLYALDTFNEDDFNTINTKTTMQMVDLRGFLRYKEFNQKLIELYRSKGTNETVVDLFPKILDWCRGS